MKGMYLRRRFYRQMFGLVLLLPVVVVRGVAVPRSLPRFAVSRLFPGFELSKEGFDFRFSDSEILSTGLVAPTTCSLTTCSLTTCMGVRFGT